MLGLIVVVMEGAMIDRAKVDERMAGADGAVAAALNAVESWRGRRDIADLFRSANCRTAR